MAPTDLMTASELREFDLHFKKAVLAGKTEAEVDGEYPGLTDAIVSAARPLVVTAMKRSMPELHKAVARVVQERLTQPQTAELITFYESPTGQSIMQAMAASTDAGDIYKRAVEREGEPITGREIAAQSRKAAEKATKTLTKAQEAEMIEWMKRPVFAKLAGVQAMVRQVLVDFHNKEDPELNANLEEALAAAAAAHMTKVDAQQKK